MSEPAVVGLATAVVGTAPGWALASGVARGVGHLINDPIGTIATAGKYLADNFDIHMALDVLGMMPVVGGLFDTVNGVLYLAEGNVADAALSFAGAVPIVGVAATGGRVARRTMGVIADAASTVSRRGMRGLDAIPASITRGPGGVGAFSSVKVDNLAPTFRRGDGVVDANRSAGRTAGSSPGSSCRINSFVPGTEVLLADGRSVPIEDLEVGDEVLATDPETGESGAREVVAAIYGYGSKVLVDVTIDGETVTATDGHPFWVNQRGEWVDAIDLQAGDVLLTPDGVTRIDHVEHRVVVDQPVHNLTVEGVHTYYVDLGNEPVLTHNCPPSGDDAVGLPPLRQAYVDDVGSLQAEVSAWRRAGASEEFIAREAWANRRAIGIQYKGLTPPDVLAGIHTRNLAKYGDELGPTISWLRQQGKSWEQMTASALRTGGKDLGF